MSRVGRIAQRLLRLVPAAAAAEPTPGGERAVASSHRTGACGASGGLWQPADAFRVAWTGSALWPSSRRSPHASGGFVRSPAAALPGADHRQQSCASHCAQPSVAGGRTAGLRSGLGCRHHLCPNRGRVAVFGGGDGSVQSPRHRLGDGHLVGDHPGVDRPRTSGGRSPACARRHGSLRSWRPIREHSPTAPLWPAMA